MATANAAAALSRADDFAADFGTATLTIYAGATALATHTLAGFTTSTDGANNAIATANAIADDTIDADGTADKVTITAGAASYDLAIGTDVTLSTTTYVTGQPSKITGLTVTFPVS